MQKELRKQINNLHLRIKDAADNSLSKSNDITIIAVSKKKTFDHIKCAYDSGVRNFGENYAQELEEKAKHLRLENIKSENWSASGARKSTCRPSEESFVLPALR